MIITFIFNWSSVSHLLCFLMCYSYNLHIQTDLITCFPAASSCDPVTSNKYWKVHQHLMNMMHLLWLSFILYDCYNEKLMSFILIASMWCDPLIPNDINNTCWYLLSDHSGELFSFIFTLSIRLLRVLKSVSKRMRSIRLGKFIIKYYKLNVRIYDPQRNSILVRVKE